MKTSKNPTKIGWRGRKRWTARASLPIAMIAVAVFSSGCLSSGYNYVNHANPDKTELYFKIPAKWKTVTYAQIIEAANGKLSQSQLSQIQGAQWIYAFSANPNFKAKQASPVGARYPEGMAFSEQISPTAQDTFSMASLRSLILGNDPAATDSQDTILTYSQFNASGGIRGSKMTVDIPQPDGKYITFGQVAEVDPATNWTYAMGIGCDASCWGPNSGLIGQVLNSWIVKAR